MTKRVEFRDDELDVVLSALCYYDTVLEDEDDGSNEEWAVSARKHRSVRARAEAVVRKAMK